MINLKTLYILLLLSCVFVDCSAAQEKPLPESSKTDIRTKIFESKEGNFSINISQEPSYVRNLGSETSDKKGIDVGKQFFWKFEKINYTVMYQNPFYSDGSAMPVNTDEMNSGVRKASERQGAKFISEKEIFCGKYPGREFNYVAPNGAKVIIRNYLINNTGYQTIAGYTDEKDEKGVLEVLNSFKLLIEKN